MALPSLKDSFISDAYYGYLHTNTVAISGSDPAWVYDGRGNRSALMIGEFGISVAGTLSAQNVAIPGVGNIVDYIFPVGSIFFSADNVNPESRFAGTTWTRIGEGRFVASAGEGEDINGNTYTVLSGNDVATGEYTHELSGDEMPAHNHEIITQRVSTSGSNSGNSGYLGSSNIGLSFSGTEQSVRSLAVQVAGGNSSHNNIPPYIGLYIWKRLT